MSTLSFEGMKTAIQARIARPEFEDDQLVPDHAMRMIDRVMESYQGAAFEAGPEDTDEDRYKRIFVYYKEFLAQIAPSLHGAAKRQFERYTAALIRGEQAPRYNIWTDGVEVYAA